MATLWRRQQSRASRTAITIGFVALSIVASSPCQADCAALRSADVAEGQSVGLRPDESLAPGVIEQAISLWQACSSYATGFPAFVVGEGTRTIVIRYDAEDSGSAKCGSFVGQTITLYATARAGDGSVLRCGSLEKNLAHEFGHVLGLGDLYDRQRCSRHIMAQIPGHGRDHRYVRSEECATVDGKWNDNLLRSASIP
jgi:hypothetical protein